MAFTFTRETRVPTGLPYRIECFRYYALQFHEAAKAMRIEITEGIQPYDKFVRRLGGALDFIDRLARRYERAITSVSNLDQNLLAIQSNKTGNDLRNI